MIPGNINTALISGAEGGYAIQRSLRFNAPDSAYLSRTPASAGNRKTWSFSCWLKKSALGARQILFSADDTQQERFGYEATDDKLYWVWAAGESYVSTAAVFRDTAAWAHIVLVSDTDNATASNRIRIYVNGVQLTLSGNTVTSGTQWTINTTNQHRIGNFSGNLLNFSGYLADIHFIDGQALDPTSFGEFDDTTGVWMPKAYTGSYGTNGFHLPFSDNSTAAALGTDTSGNGNTWSVNNFQATVQTGRLYAQASGTSTSAFSSATLLGNFPATVGGSYAIYDADLVTPVTSATFSYLYSFSSVVEVLVSADGTNWTSKGNQSSSYTTVSHTSAFRYVRWFYSTFNFGITNNPAQNDSLVDVPSSTGTDTGVGGEVRGNYCTWNALNNPSVSATLSNGNLDVAANTSNFQAVVGTIFPSSGKWYAELTISGTASDQVVGIAAPSFVPSTANNRYIGRTADSYGFYSDGQKIYNNVFSAYGNAWSVGDVLRLAFDLDNGKVWLGINGTWQASGDPAAGTNAAFTGLSGGFSVACSPYRLSVAGAFTLNAGQRPFAYTAPSGFKALNTANLPAPVVTKPSDVMDVKLYTGNGSTQTISGLGFSPDLVWLKARATVGVDRPHQLFDTVRGAPKALSSNRTDAEDPTGGYDNDGALTAFTSDGFTVENGPAVNSSSSPYVTWTWDAGSSTVTNTQGSISSQLRANASAGFSVITWTGQTAAGSIGHGLGVAPSLIICKARSNAQSWGVYHKDVGINNYLLLDSTGASTAYSGIWGSSAPTSTVFNVPGNVGLNNNNGWTYVAYCFAPVAGYSSFGSYTGNGSADGPFVYTGFRPRWVLIKRSNSTSNWSLFDTARDTSNVSGFPLFPNDPASEVDIRSTTPLDILSNGFKLRTSTLTGGTNINISSATYIYAAFAEAPFNYARAR